MSEKNNGVILKGKFCPMWGGVNMSKSVNFFSGGCEGISVAILASNHDACIIEEYEE